MLSLSPILNTIQKDQREKRYRVHITFILANFILFKYLVKTLVMIVIINLLRVRDCRLGCVSSPPPGTFPLFGVLAISKTFVERFNFWHLQATNYSDLNLQRPFFCVNEVGLVSKTVIGCLSGACFSPSLVLSVGSLVDLST